MSYTVRSGDTMSAIAARHNISLKALIAANPQVRNPNLIYSGQTLNIPGRRDDFVPAPSSQPQTTATGGTVYTVRSGDTMSAIAARYNVTLQALVAANRHITNASLIYPGQKLTIPGTRSSQQPVAATPSEDVRRGSQGSAVRWVQDALVRLGYMTAAQVATGPGVFGPQTDAAVRRFQRDRGLVADGIVGPYTRQAFAAALQGGGAPSQVAVDHNTTLHYDGSKPAPGTTRTDAWNPVNAPIQSVPGNRSVTRYNDAINQFAVGVNPRYAKRNGNTYCNIFVWDVTRAMGAEIPHWVDGNGNPVGVGKGRELSANGVCSWLKNHGARFGWKKVSAAEAQAAANQGKPVVSSWHNPGGIGHVGIVRPGEITDRGPAAAQAGAKNFNRGHVADGFGSRPVEYWVHD